VGKQEIVQDPIVKIVDDYSKEELPSGTSPSRYQLNGRSYDLYLSGASKRAVDAFIANLTADAEEVRHGGPRRGGSGDRIKQGYTIHDLRAWAKQNGYKVSPNRRAPGHVIRAFNQAH
jgi:hypothetical protein